MIENNKAGDEFDRYISRATITWEWWIIIASLLYVFARLIPWALDGFVVVS